MQSVFTHCYEVGSYDLLIDYGQARPVALNNAEAAWGTARLVEHGWRSAD